MSFSDSYTAAFRQTHAALAKTGAFKEPFYGPNASQLQELVSRAKKFIPGAASDPALAHRINTERPLGSKIRTAFTGFANTDRVLAEHMSHRMKNPDPVVGGKSYLPHAAGAGALGVGGTLGAQHLMARRPGMDGPSPGMDGPSPGMGEQPYGAEASGGLSPDELGFLQEYYGE